MRAAVLVLVAGLLALTGCGGDDEQAAGGASPTPTPDRAGKGPWQITGGATTLALQPELEQLLRSTGVAIRPTDGARRRGGKIVLPVVGGQLQIEPVDGRLDHTGTLELGRPGRALSATNLQIEPHEDRVTAEVEGRRIPLLSADFGGMSLVDAPRRLVMPPSSARISDEAATLLNDKIGASFFGPGARIGEVSVEAIPADTPR